MDAAGFHEDVERLRARLNHDLLKNDVLLGLHRLRSVLSGEVESSEPVSETLGEIQEGWRRTEKETRRLIELLRDAAWTSGALSLPFVRHLPEYEKALVQEMLLSRLESSGVSRYRDRLAAPLAAAGAAMHALELQSGRQNVDVAAVDTALVEVKRLSAALGDLRLVS